MKRLSNRKCEDITTKKIKNFTKSQKTEKTLLKQNFYVQTKPNCHRQ